MESDTEHVVDNLGLEDIINNNHTWNRLTVHKHNNI